MDQEWGSSTQNSESVLTAQKSWESPAKDSHQAFLQSESGPPDSSKPNASKNAAKSVADGTSTNLQIVSVLLKCCFGSAFLVMPQGNKSAGLIGGPVILVVVYLFMLFGMLLLLESRIAWGRPVRYQDMGVAFGPWGKSFITFSSVILQFGFNCIWVVTCEKNFTMIFPDWSNAGRLWLLCPFVVALSMVRRLRVFTVPNVMGILLCLSSWVYLTWYASDRLVKQGPAELVFFNTENADSLLWVGTCGYMFELICQVVPIYEAAKDKQAVPRLLAGSTAVIVVLYIGFGALFYAAFGEATADLATMNLPMGSAMGKVVPLLFALGGVITMPINFFVIFQAYEPALRWPEGYQARKWAKNIVRLLVCASVYCVSWAGGDKLTSFLSLVGGLFGVNLALCVPTALHLVICKPTGCRKFLDIFSFVVGLAIMAVSGYQSISSWK